LKHFLVLSVLVCLLLTIGGAILTTEAETVAQAAQPTSTSTPEATKPGYTNYSGYYRIRCWPACHTKDIPESIKKSKEAYQGD
jgi:hypothetical protein